MPVDCEVWRGRLGDDALFMDGTVKEMVGFLDDFAAKRTIDILNFQKKSHVAGSLYEIGLYYGKYFGLLVRSAASMGSKVVGIDTFEYVSLNDFSQYFADKFDPEALGQVARFDLEIFNGRSGDLSEDDLLHKLGSRPRFVSIDGSHEYDDVLWDLRVADQILAAHGVIAVDDFLHPISLGVTAATYEILFSTPTLVPFAYVANKLFLCRYAWADRYRAAVELGVMEDRDDQRSEDYRRHRANGDTRQIESMFRGYRILTVRL